MISMTQTSMTQTMLLVTSSWNDKKTFRLIPVTPDAPFNEAIYDVDVKVLAVIGKDKKESFQMIPKLNEFGDPLMLKSGKRQEKDYAEIRSVIPTYYEYYITEVSDIVNLINILAVNADSFDYQEYLSADTAPLETKEEVES